MAGDIQEKLSGLKMEYENANNKIVNIAEEIEKLEIEHLKNLYKEKYDKKRRLAKELEDAEDELNIARKELHEKCSHRKCERITQYASTCYDRTTTTYKCLACGFTSDLKPKTTLYLIHSTF